MYGLSRWPPNTSNPTETVVDPNGPSLGRWIHIPRFRFFDSILRFAVFLDERAQEEGTLPFMQKRAQFFFCIKRRKLSNTIPELCRIIAAYGHMLMYAIATHDGMAKCSSWSHSPAPRKRSPSIVVSSSHSSNKQQIATKPEPVEPTSVQRK